MLCEHFDYRRGRGKICAIEVVRGHFGPPEEVALGLPIHLSYPCVVEEDGVVYCVPEALDTREVALFRGDPFPTVWTKTSVLLEDVAAVDPTIFHHGGRWWLAYADGDIGMDADLVLWHAANLVGPWKPHRTNPVKRDARSARPAGTPFVHEGRLYRPAQDCSRTYGARIVIHEVITLTTEEFTERPVATIEPTAGSPYPAGRHTLSAFGDMTLIDGHRLVFVGVAFRQFLRICVGDLLTRVSRG